MKKFTRLSRAQYRRLADEHSLQVSVMGYLAYNARPDVYWFAVPNAGRRGWQTARRMKAEGLTAGVADICFMLPRGRAAWMELKTTTGRPSPVQLAFAAICKRLKHHYCLARDLPEAIDALRKWGVLKKESSND